MPTPGEYQKMLAGGCPWCGDELIIRQGQYGEFIACAEWCGYTKSIVGRSSSPDHPFPPTRGKKVCPDHLCDGSGLLPFKNKEGKVIPHTYLFCKCNPLRADDTTGAVRPHEYAGALQPDDFDFSCSYSFYRSLCQEHGWQDPGCDFPPEPEPAREQVIVHRHSDMGPKEHDLLQQTALRLTHLEKKLAEQQAKKKKPSTSSYKGIR